jgi:hypothetical protein
MVRALVRLNLIRLLHSSMLWVPLGASMALAFLWSNVLHVDALNTHAPANGWDLLLMLQNNGKILAFALVVPFSLWTGDLVAVDRERGYRAQLCLRTAHQAPWAYPLALVASVVLGDGGRGSGCETAARAPMLAISTNTRATHRRALVSHAHIFEPPALWFGSPTGLMLCNFAAAQGVDLR